MKPTVSIIMPTYNRAWIIQRAIDSVLQQTYRDFELLIIDDGSTDDTSAILSGLSDERVHVLHSEHQGAAHARNLAAAQAAGRYIAYLDTDNTYLPRFLEVMLQALDDDYVLAYSDQHLHLAETKSSTPTIVATRLRSTPYNPVALLERNYIDLNSAVHHREVFSLIGTFDETLEQLEDWDLFVRLALARPFQIRHVEQVLGDYYYFLQSATTTVTNNFAWDAGLRAQFGWHESTNDSERRIRDKIAQLRHASYRTKDQ